MDDGLLKDNKNYPSAVNLRRICRVGIRMDIVQCVCSSLDKGYIYSVFDNIVVMRSWILIMVTGVCLVP